MSHTRLLFRKGSGSVSYTHLDVYKRQDAKKAVELGAEGIGLCRTEHMFFGEGRIDAFREMICSETAEAVSYTHLGI